MVSGWHGVKLGGFAAAAGLGVALTAGHGVAAADPDASPAGTRGNHEATADNTTAGPGSSAPRQPTAGRRSSLPAKVSDFDPFPRHLHSALTELDTPGNADHPSLAAAVTDIPAVSPIGSIYSRPRSADPAPTPTLTVAPTPTPTVAPPAEAPPAVHVFGAAATVPPVVRSVPTIAAPAAAAISATGIATVLHAAAVGILASGSPAGPVDSPILYAVLAWARREGQRLFTPKTATARIPAAAQVISDTQPPTANVVVADTALKAGETSVVTVTFAEAVTGFTNADLTVANGALSSVSSGDGGITWTATLTPAAGVTDATNLVSLDLTGVSDLAGNAGTGTTDSNNYAIDTVRPTGSVVVADTALKAGETSLVTVTFAEAVTGFTNADLTVANGALSSVSSGDGGITWTATLTPAAGVTDATNVIQLDLTGVSDLAGNAGVGTANSNNYAIDTVRPMASVVVADTALTAGETSGVTITFTEAVEGFTNSDLTVANGTLSPATSSDGGITWTATLTPSADTTDATNVISLDLAGVTDGSGNAGVDTTDSNNYAINTRRPTATIAVADTALKAGETSLVTITFADAVTDFTNADLAVANGTLSTATSSDGGITWTATLTPSTDTTDATNLITLDNTGVADLAGNAGVGTTDSSNYAIDTRRPTATIALADTALKAGKSTLVTITFSEAVTGFTNADLTVANGTLSTATSSDGGITWTATLTPSARTRDTTNVITLDNAGVTDLTGNPGTGVTESNNYAVDTKVGFLTRVIEFVRALLPRVFSWWSPPAHSVVREYPFAG